MHRARREIEVSAEMLMRDQRPQLNSQDNQNTWNSFRADVWPANGKLSPDGDKVGGKLELFRRHGSALPTDHRQGIRSAGKDRQIGQWTVQAQIPLERQENLAFAALKSSLTDFGCFQEHLLPSCGLERYALKSMLSHLRGS